MSSLLHLLLILPSSRLTFTSSTHSASETRTDLQDPQQLVPVFLPGLDSSEGGALVEKRAGDCPQSSQGVVEGFVENLGFDRFCARITFALCGRMIKKMALILHHSLNLHLFDLIS